LVGDVEVRCCDRFAAAVVRLEDGVEEAAGEGGCAEWEQLGGQLMDHLLDALKQIGEVHVGAAVLEPEAGGVLAASAWRQATAKSFTGPLAMRMLARRSSV